MKKKIPILFLVIFILAATASGVLLARDPVSRAASQTKESVRPLTLLVLGLDSAASNTDAILLVRYSPAEKTLSLLQLPRDTYFENGNGLPKLNHIYASLYARTHDSTRAAKETKEQIEKAFGIPLDGCIALRFSALSDIVDRMGGVPISLPFAMEYTDPAQDLTISLPAGETVLSGEQALHFVRYRSGYVEGDLGRVDAQKLFLAAFMRRASEKLSPFDLLPYFTAKREDLTVVFDQKSGLLPIIFDFYKNKSAVRALFASLPGEALRDEDGVWYYVLNRAATEELLARLLARDARDFDTAGLFCRDDLHFENIYFDRGYAPRILSEGDLEYLKILTKE